MAQQGHKRDLHRPKHINPSNLTFSVYTAEEIRKLSVVEVVTPLLFDALGNPVSGGLYDKRLGPMSERTDPCGTCHKNSYLCPGHFGHINLPLPLINPLFGKLVSTLLKISCLNCHKIQIPNHIKKSIAIQLKLLNHGLVTEAQEVDEIMANLIGQYESLDNIPEEHCYKIKEFESLCTNSKTEVFLNKNVEAIRNNFVNSMFREIKNRKKCMHCKDPILAMKLLKGKIILNVPKLDTSGRGTVKSYDSKYVNAEEQKKHLRSIWAEETEFMSEVVSVLKDIEGEHPTDSFFFNVIPVPPTNVRPVNVVAGRMVEHGQTQAYKQILFNILTLKTIIGHVQKKDQSQISVQAQELYKSCRGETAIEKLNHAWEELQTDINCLVDKDVVRGRDGLGLKQIIEKKSGVIRMHMMGKRVNFAARSVITPDPNLNIDEIGVPEAFAKHLTYPVPVTAWNVEEMRKLITNGPDVHPGAIMVEFEDGKVMRINKQVQDSILKRLLTPDKDTVFRGVKIVHRHLQNGDIMLLNRQPTLHKPSIMAHQARILKGEKTLRLHYANCKAYNADFDGDEMNAHLPQNELARSEGYNLVNVANQYLVPKDGTPLSGLIQDHMISGVRLSLRGRFFTQQDYEQLCYQALSYMTGPIKLLQPSILKPQVLWSGKQILSTILINVIGAKHLINLTSTSKISHKAWQTMQSRPWQAGGTPFKNPSDMSEAEVIIRQGQLLVGILDKTHYGATQFGLVHCIYELYGGSYAIRFLSCLAKLFTRFLQQEGFTLGVKDILTVAEADVERTRIIKESRKIGKQTVAQALDVSDGLSAEEIVHKIEEELVANPKLRAVIDRQYKSALDSFTNDINKVCLPAGLVSKFPANNLQLMVQSGAKGSTVNTMQISCLLGQIELEGKRPPCMISGKTLPSFPSTEFSPRAGGFIDGRFMTGIQPQEFFFHCMAGREGLIDTAVKTSRSGYLQRCLIKHLEGLHVNYDQTVRDSDKSVVQFYYGEDGFDINKAQFINKGQLPFLADNHKVILDKQLLKQLTAEQSDEFKQELKNVKSKKQRSVKERKSPFSLFSAVVLKKMGADCTRQKCVKLWQKADDSIKQSFRDMCTINVDPLTSRYQADAHYGVVNERIANLIQQNNVDKTVDKMLRFKVLQSYCHAGEPVGLLAAQSIGEPSTQMTLNTFHFAGRGDMNVTLGIPRLREILMMASKNIKTPSMECPFLPLPDVEHRAETLRKSLIKVLVSDVLQDIDVTTSFNLQGREYVYTLRFNFLPHRCYEEEFSVNPKQIIRHMRKRFLAEMFSAIMKISKVKSNVVAMEEERKRPVSQAADSDDEGGADKTQSNPAAAPGNSDSSDDEVEDTEDAKLTMKHEQQHEDQEPEIEEKEKSDDEFEEEEQDGGAEKTESEDAVLQKYNFAQNYIEDKKRHEWCQITFALPLKFKKLDLTNILRDVANKSVVWQVQNINRAITYLKDDKLTLRTDGINMQEMFKHNTLLDLQKMYTNDIHRMAETYGIEAAAKIIVKEVKDVFNVYGIKVDPRHLSLIADYMTYNGTFEPLSRKGMESSASPLQQISFESSLTFLKNAISRGRKDYLDSPSSSLMVGTPCRVGTGVFTLVHKLAC